MLFSSQIFFHEDFLSGEGIRFREIHQRGVGGRKRCENLHLSGINVQLLAGEGFDQAHIVPGAAGMGGHEVVREELIFS